MLDAAFIMVIKRKINMKMNFSPLLLISICLLSCTSKKAFNKKIKAKHTVEELRDDLSIVKKSLENNHPGVFWYINKKDFDFKFDSLTQSLKEPATSLEFYRQLAPVVASVKCGHTKLVYPGLRLSKTQKDSLKKRGDLSLSQLNYIVDSNRVFIKNAGKKQLDSLKGTEIVSIDGIEVSTIIKACESLYASDGYNQTFYPAALEKSFDVYYYLRYGRSDSSKMLLKKANANYEYVLKTIKPANKEKRILTPEEVGKKKIADKYAKKLKRKNQYKGLDKFGKPLLDLKFDSVLNNTAIMTVKSFSFDHSNFRKFFRESFKELEERNIEHLVLDLRDNGGGNLLNCSRLFRYLYNQPHQFTGKAYTKNSYVKAIKHEDKLLAVKVLGVAFYPITLLSKFVFERKDSVGYHSYIPTAHPKKPLKSGFNGALKVLINGYSFSATSLLSANLQSVKRGTFIGEETGGGYNQCTAGRIPYLNLPNTGLKLRLPLRVIQLNQKRDLYGRGIFPDVEVKENFKDVLNNKDALMEKAKL